jgi:hypothetical protein
MAMLQASWIKVSRAVERLQELADATIKYLEASPFTVEYRYEPDQRDEHAIVVASCLPPPATLALLTGEVVQSLRTSLDYAIGTLIEKATGAPAVTASFEFPIFSEKDRYESARPRKLRGVPARHVQVIDSAQPFTHNTPWKHSLWLLHRLNIEDKHRALHVVAGAMWTSRAKHVGGAGPDAFSFAQSWIDDPLRFPLEVGTELFRYHAQSEVPADVEIEFQPVVLFSSPSEVAKWEILPLLTSLVNSTQTVLDALEETPFESG